MASYRPFTYNSQGRPIDLSTGRFLSSEDYQYRLAVARANGARSQVSDETLQRSVDTMVALGFDTRENIESNLADWLEQYSFASDMGLDTPDFYDVVAPGQTRRGD